MVDILTETVALALAVSSASMTIAKSRLFAPARDAAAKRYPWLGELISCPYCVSHWLALFASILYRPAVVDSGFVALDLAVAAFAIVSLAAFSSGMIFRAFSAIVEERAEDVEAGG